MRSRQRETYKIGTIASKFGTGSHIITPQSWVGKQVMAMLRQEWDDKMEQMDFLKEQLRNQQSETEGR